jgi:hypothetical protein
MLWEGSGMRVHVYAQWHPLKDPLLEDPDKCLYFYEPVTHAVRSVRHDKRVHEAVQAVEAGRGVSGVVTMRLGESACLHVHRGSKDPET